MHDLLVEIPLLTPEECGRVAADVEALRSSWVPRAGGNGYVFHTLGVACYLDSDRYYEMASTSNQQMDRSFSWLYERVLQALSGALQCPVELAPHAARPGFHIMRPSKEMVIPMGDLHCDVQFLRIDWIERERTDFSSPVSYTMAVRTPRSGAGLNLWPLTDVEFHAMDASARDRVARDCPPEYLPYREGTLVCHSGLRVHTVAPSGPGLRPDDMRLTLQGHALRCEDTYLLYW